MVAIDVRSLGRPTVYVDGLDVPDVQTPPVHAALIERIQLVPEASMVQRQGR